MSTLKSKIFQSLASNDIVWSLLKKPVYWSDSVKHYRNIYTWQRDIAPIVEKGKKLFADLTVQNGPFKGMKYPDFIATCSSIFPKLLGSYEREIHPWIEDILNKSYSDVIDIGCAEGYYAIGFALKMKGTTIHAYDTDPVSQDACLAMARVNNVEDRVKINATCTADTLKNFSPSGKVLIVSDCEGYEKKLFTQDNIDQLKKHDILIEVHDIWDNTTSTYLKELFSKTHKLQIVDSISDHLKVMRYNYPELKTLSYNEKKHMLEEGRQTTMEWFYFTPLL